MAKIDLRKLKRVKIGNEIFYKDLKCEKFYSKKKNLDEKTFNEILKYKKVNFVFI